MNRLISILASCDLSDVSSLRRLYEKDGRFEMGEVTIQCEETHRSTPEYVRFNLGFPLDLFGLSTHEEGLNVMTADYFLRKFSAHIESIDLEKEHTTKKEMYTGKIFFHSPNQKILLRNSSYVKNDSVYISLVIRFPVHMMSKRNVIAGKLSVRIVRKGLERAVRNLIQGFDIKDYQAKANVYKHQLEIRGMLEEKGLVSFIANGSLLPRNANGFVLHGAVPFKSPQEDEIRLTLSDGFAIKGMGIREGVTVITGGGYSGKSTLLDAMLSGIFNHVPGDGLEYCITRQNSCKIIAEDGRRVTGLDISPFVRNVGSFDTERFTTPHASGSTSQAANIMEALSFGCGALLIDEDRTATNFMIRDARMKKIIKDDPIIPFTDRARQIYADLGTSTVLIIGGSGEYLDLADNVYIMKDFCIYNYNTEIEQTRQNGIEFFTVYDERPVKWRQGRLVTTDSLSAYRREESSNVIKEYVAVTEEEIAIGNCKANISRLATVISRQQVNAIAFILHNLFTKESGAECDIFAEVSELYGNIEKNGLESVYSNRFEIDFNLELPALHDILFAFSRMDGIIYR